MCTEYDKSFIGREFGRFTVESFSHKDGKNAYYVCVCSCEAHTRKVVSRANLASGSTKSCGCLFMEQARSSVGQKVEMVDGTTVSKYRISKPMANNTSGYRGVTWHKKNKKWQAQIELRGKSYYLGQYSNAEEAAAAYQEARVKILASLEGDQT